MSKAYGADKLAILAFPSDEFGGQELKTADEICAFTDKAGVSADNGFYMMEKTKVNGPDAHPVWQFLKSKEPGDVRWNFAAQFVVDKDGNVVKRAGNSDDVEAAVGGML